MYLHLKGEYYQCHIDAVKGSKGVGPSAHAVATGPVLRSPGVIAGRGPVGVGGLISGVTI